MNFDLEKMVERIAEDNELSQEFSRFDEMDEVYNYCKDMGLECDEDEFDDEISGYIDALNEEDMYSYEGNVSDEDLSKVGGGAIFKSVFSKSVAMVLSLLTMGGCGGIGLAGATDSSKVSEPLGTGISFSEKISNKWSNTKKSLSKFYDNHKKIVITSGVTLGALILAGSAVLMNRKLKESRRERRNEIPHNQKSKLYKNYKPKSKKKINLSIPKADENLDSQNEELDEVFVRQEPQGSDREKSTVGESQDERELEFPQSESKTDRSEDECAPQLQQPASMTASMLELSKSGSHSEETSDSQDKKSQKKADKATELEFTRQKQEEAKTKKEAEKKEEAKLKREEEERKSNDIEEYLRESEERTEANKRELEEGLKALEQEQRELDEKYEEDMKIADEECKKAQRETDEEEKALNEEKEKERQEAEDREIKAMRERRAKELRSDIEFWEKTLRRAETYGPQNNIEFYKMQLQKLRNMLAKLYRIG